MSQDYRLKLSKNFEKKKNKEGIEILKGQKMINSVTYRIQLEDHTVGDVLIIYLLKNKDVRFAGYRIPHPLDDILQIKVQTAAQDTNRVVNETLQLL